MNPTDAPRLLSPGPDHAASEAALRAWWAATDPTVRADIERDLWARFGRTVTVVVVDMCGFSRRAREDGLIGTLAMIGLLRVTIAEVAAVHGALALKFEADNALVAFETSDQAMAAARRAMADLRATADQPIDISVGVDRGAVLLLDGTDLYGDPVNTASKLGEDLARRGEIVVTPAVAGDLMDAGALRPVALSLAGLPFAAFSEVVEA